MRMAVAKRFHNALDRTEGLTLIEVLASVVILSFAFLTIITLITNILVQSHHVQHKQQAILIARDIFSEMAATSATAVVQQGDRLVQRDGITYRVHPSIVSNPPAWAQGLVYVEVKVTWTSVFNGQSSQESVDLTQAFPQ
jgi:Tfp pilus assembly protein PilV